MVRIAATIVLTCLVVSTLTQGVRASRVASQDQVQQGNDLLKRSEEENFRNHALALATAREALTRFQAAGDIAGMARAYFQIGRCNHAMSEFVEATNNYQLALERWRELNNAHEQAETLIMMAFVEQRKGEWLNAIAYYNQAQTLGQDDPYQVGQIASGLADLFNENGMPESALVQYERALDAYQQTGEARAINRTTFSVGYTEFLQKKYPEALATLQEVLGKLDLTSLDAAECYEYLGRVHLALGEHAAALKVFEPALSIYEGASNTGEAERVRTLIGQVYEEQGDLTQARPRYLQALSVFQRLEDRISEALVYFSLGRLELKAGRLDDAETYLKQSIESTEGLRNISIGRDITTAFSASVHDRYEAYITCLLRKSKLTASSPALAEQAFEASELSRARALLELLRDTRTNLLAGVDPQLAEREKTLRQTIRAKMDYRAQLLKSDYDKKELSDVETNLERLQEEHRQLSEQLRNLNPAYSQITQPTAYSLKQIQTELIDDDKTALLEYILGDEASYVWVVTRNNITVTELAGKAAITKAVQNTYALLSAKPKGDGSALAKAIEDVAALVITPIANQIPSQRIIVVADGALHYIPFQMLPLGADKQPLVATREIINAPSASILGQLRQEKTRRDTPQNVVAAFGYPAFASNYPELKNTNSGDLIANVKVDENEQWSYAMRDIEVGEGAVDVSTVQPLIYSREELANLREVAGPASFFATGFDASRTTLENTDLSKYAIVHFATHGVLDPNRPERSGFLLSTVNLEGQSQNGFITIQDVYRLRAPVSLVVLSACRTGLGKDVRGEGLISLTRGFMYAGASSIAASLWNVNDEVTAELMKRFYANMLQNAMTPAAALRAAQNSIRQQPRWSSPHYWAAFTIQGEYQQPPKLPDSHSSVFTVKRIIVALLVLFALGAIGWWYLRRRRVRAAT